jgi:hypothetical protein
MAGLVAVLLTVAGQPEDAQDIEAAKDAWAKAVRELGDHEAWLRKLGEGGETSDRAVAWLKFLIATLAMLLPILLRHGAIPANVAQFLSLADGMVPAEPASPGPVDESVAA